MSDAPHIEALKAIAHPLRYAIIDALAKGDQNVGEIEGATGIGQPTLSQQLAVLRKAGLVETRRQAKLVYYSIDKDRARTVLESLAFLGEPAPGTSVDKPERSRGAANFARLVT